MHRMSRDKGNISGVPTILVTTLNSSIAPMIAVNWSSWGKIGRRGKRSTSASNGSRDRDMVSSVSEGIVLHKHRAFSGLIPTQDMPISDNENLRMPVSSNTRRKSLCTPDRDITSSVSRGTSRVRNAFPTACRRRLHPTLPDSLIAREDSDGKVGSRDETCSMNGSPGRMVGAVIASSFM